MVRDDTLGEISEVTATRREHERLGEKKLKLPIITSTSVRIANCAHCRLVHGTLGIKTICNRNTV